MSELNHNSKPAGGGAIKTKPSKQDVDRETWTGKYDFVLSCIGYAVGLGNVWRFPYLCYRNGGGAFLIPYFVMLIIAGIPLFFFELALGQFASSGPITVWSVNPLFYGIGWGMVAIVFMKCIYYNVVVMYSVFYMFVSLVSLDSDVPWSTCDNHWNTPSCRIDPYPQFDAMTNETQKAIEKIQMMDFGCVNTTFNSLALFGVNNFTSAYDLDYDTLNSANFTSCNLKLRVPSDEYWTRFVLGLPEADGLNDVGGVNLKNFMCLLIAWLVVFFCLMNGIKTSGKVVYFTATFPYVILTVLLVRGVTLPGCLEGIKFYIIPDWDEILNPKVWGDAAAQIFYSLGTGFGGLITMASFNNFRNNACRDAIIISAVNSFTSIYAGFAIFSLLGFMANQTNQPVRSVVASGTGLAFVAYPEGLARLPASSFWAFLFFFMLFILGLDSQFAMMETVISGLSDMFPHQLRKRKALFTLFCCSMGLLVGIACTTKGGIYVLTLIDWYCASYSLMMMSFLEIVAVIWVYGIKKFVMDVEMMLGEKSKLFWAYWVSMWVVVTPVSTLFIVVMAAIFAKPANYGSLIFPDWAQGVGWLLVAVPLVMSVIGAIYQIYKKGGVKKAIVPEKHWGPRLAVDRTGRYNDGLGFDPANDIKFGDENKLYSIDKVISKM